MFENTLKPARFVAFVAMLFFSFQALCSTPAKDIQKLNNSLIFHLFINYELTERNGNLTTIVDFLPSLDNPTYKSVKVSSNIGGYDQSSDFLFKENGALESVAYIVRNRMYGYDFVYTQDKVSAIKLNGKQVATVNYDKEGRLFSIFREMEGRVFQHVFQYLDGESKAIIHLAVQQGSDRRSSTNETYVTWDENFRVESYCLGLYCSKNMQYTEQGYVLAYSFRTNLDSNTMLNWEYSAIDANKSWTERKMDKVWFTREIEYR
jgi:hypothetical protein